MSELRFYEGGRLDALPPLHLYVHVPWCVRKCPYCDFNSHEIKKGGFDDMAYVDLLLADLVAELPFVWGRQVMGIFIGGGTPGLLSGEAVEKLLSGIRSLVNLSPMAEITMETNPGALEAGRYAQFRNAGVNRLSIGVQSFNDKHLKSLGRIHDSKLALEAIAEAKKSFDRINLDLMYALPHQSVDEALEDVGMALAQGTTHLSFYQLTLEPNTLFAVRPPEGMPDDDLAADIEDAVHAALKDGGFRRYEVSAFAKSVDARAAHNLNYWLFGDYMGIGAGAHGKISSAFGVERTMRPKNPRDYEAAVMNARDGKDPEATALRSSSPIAKDDFAGEFMMNALRLIDGFPKRLFTERTGLAPTLLAKLSRKPIEEGLLVDEGDVMRPTPRGLLYLNDLMECFLDV